MYAATCSAASRSGRTSMPTAGSTSSAVAEFTSVAGYVPNRDNSAFSPIGRTPRQAGIAASRERRSPGTSGAGERHAGGGDEQHDQRPGARDPSPRARPGADVRAAVAGDDLRRAGSNVGRHVTVTSTR
jgi:hypothetical protein